jgi:hypothetical protein
MKLNWLLATLFSLWLTLSLPVQAVTLFDTSSDSTSKIYATTMSAAQNSDITVTPQKPPYPATYSTQNPKVFQQGYIEIGLLSCVQTSPTAILNSGTVGIKINENVQNPNGVAVSILSADLSTRTISIPLGQTVSFRYSSGGFIPDAPLVKYTIDQPTSFNVSPPSTIQNVLTILRNDRKNPSYLELAFLSGTVNTSVGKLAIELPSLSLSIRKTGSCYQCRHPLSPWLELVRVGVGNARVWGAKVHRGF